MKKNPVILACLAIFGGCILVVSLLTGCSGSVEGKGIRVTTGESVDNEDQFSSP